MLKEWNFFFFATVKITLNPRFSPGRCFLSQHSWTKWKNPPVMIKQPENRQPTWHIIQGRCFSDPTCFWPSHSSYGFVYITLLRRDNGYSFMIYYKSTMLSLCYKCRQVVDLCGFHRLRWFGWCGPFKGCISLSCAIRVLSVVWSVFYLLIKKGKKMSWKSWC